MKTLTLTLPMAALLFALNTFGAEKGAEKLLGARPLNAGAPVAVAKADCPKCNVQKVTVTDASARGTTRPTSTVVASMGADCGTKITTVGHGKAKTDKPVSFCKHLATASNASCCAH